MFFFPWKYTGCGCILHPEMIMEVAGKLFTNLGRPGGLVTVTGAGIILTCRFNYIRQL